MPSSRSWVLDRSCSPHELLTKPITPAEEKHYKSGRFHPTLAPAGAVLQRIYQLPLPGSPIRAGRDLADQATKQAGKEP